MNCPTLAFSTQKNVTAGTPGSTGAETPANLHQRPGIHTRPCNRHALAALDGANREAVVELRRCSDGDLGTERSDHYSARQAADHPAKRP